MYKVYLSDPSTRMFIFIEQILLVMEEEKKLAAHHAVSFIKSGMIVGLGTGSTAEYMIRRLAEEVKAGMTVAGVPSSARTEKLARSLGIQLTTLDKAGQLDINIDGADEFDSQLRLIKGGGGALLREKIIAYNSRHNIIIADSSKQVEKLGRFKLPVETIPFATPSIIHELEKMGLKPIIRTVNEVEFRTDENNCIVDIDIWETEDPDRLNTRLLGIPGVVETGLFLDLANLIIMAKGSSVETFEKHSD